MRDFILANKSVIVELLKENADYVVNDLGKWFGIGKCGAYVRMALEGRKTPNEEQIEGWKVDIKNQANAKDYAPSLLEAGYRYLGETSPTQFHQKRNRFLSPGEKIKLNGADYKAKELDIAIIDDGGTTGHIAMCDGFNWYSDHLQNDCAGGKKYRKPLVKIRFYRIVD